MSRATENTQFTCEHCGMVVEPLENGSYRNHCPSCLYSKHEVVTKDPFSIYKQGYFFCGRSSRIRRDCFAQISLFKM